MGVLPRHLLPDTASVDAGGRLSIGGCRPSRRWSSEHGTPLFVYDEAHLRARCREAVAAFPDGVAYATKAFLCLAMARLVHEEGMLLDVATGGELHVALAPACPRDRLVLHGNNKSDGELRHALETGVGRIVVDSFDELDRLDRLVPTVPDRVARPRVLVRVTPGVEAHTHEYVMTGQVDSKFGFGLASGDADRARSTGRRRPPASSWSGSTPHRQPDLPRRLLRPGDRRRSPRSSTALDLPELVVGGGLGVAYVEGEEAPSITEWADSVRDACAAAGITARVTAEPGRAIVAAAGAHALPGGHDQGAARRSAPTSRSTAA